MPFELPAQPDPHLPERWCIFDGPLLWLTSDGALPDAQGAAGRSLGGRHFLGCHEGVNLFLAEEVAPSPGRPGQWLPLRQALMTLSANLVPAVARAAQIRQFRHTHRYCGHCAAPLYPHAHDQGLACRACGQMYYPRLSPAMMVAVWRGEELLLARSPHFAPGIYSALAGFVEPGETLEECVYRETHEEVGVTVHNLRYVGSQSWPFPHSLMLAFTAEYRDGVLTPQPGEIEAAGWFSVHDLPEIPRQLSIAHWLITRTARWLRAGRPESGA